MDRDEKIIFAQFVIELFIHLAIGITVSFIMKDLSYIVGAILVLLLICVPALILFAIRCWYLFD